MSLLSAAERLAAIDRAQVVLNADRCLHSKDRRSTCADCYNICPVGAIAPGKPPKLNSDICQNCLACLPVCPTGAYAADDDVVSLLSAAGRIEGHTLEVLCQQNPLPESGLDASATGLRVNHCLAGLGSGALIALAALGLEQIYLRCESCPGCKWAALETEIKQQAARANDFLRAWGKEGLLQTVSELKDAVERPLWNADSPPMSRRDLFRVMARKGSTVMARAMQAGLEGNDKRPGRDRMRTLGAVQHLPAWTSAADAGLSGLRFASARVAETCTACGACAKACPTGALEYTKGEDGQSFTLKFTARKCIDCGFCVHVCMPAAIQKEPASFEQVFAQESITLREGKLVRCARCRTPIAERPGTTLCLICEQRSKNPFGSVVPKGAQAAMDTNPGTRGNEINSSP